MKKKEFIAVALDPEYETFVVHITFLSSTSHNVYHSRRLHISDLIAKETPTKISNKYVDFADIFSLELASKLPKHTKINDYTIKLVDG